MAKRACVLCGEMAGSWSLCYITLCGTSQTLCEKCMRRYRDAAGEEKIALRGYGPVPSPERGGRRCGSASPGPGPVAAGAGAGAGAPAAGGAAPGPGEKTARCCGRDMTKLGVSTFQLGEHTFWAVTWTICCQAA